MYVCEVRSSVFEPIANSYRIFYIGSEASLFARTNTSPFTVVEGTITEPKY